MVSNGAQPCKTATVRVTVLLCSGGTCLGKLDLHHVDHNGAFYALRRQEGPCRFPQGKPVFASAPVVASHPVTNLAVRRAPTSTLLTLSSQLALQLHGQAFALLRRLLQRNFWAPSYSFSFLPVSPCFATICRLRFACDGCSVDLP